MTCRCFLFWLLVSNFNSRKVYLTILIMLLGFISISSIDVVVFGNIEHRLSYMFWIACRRDFNSSWASHISLSLSKSAIISSIVLVLFLHLWTVVSINYISYSRPFCVGTFLLAPRPNCSASLSCVWETYWPMSTKSAIALWIAESNRFLSVISYR